MSLATTTKTKTKTISPTIKTTTHPPPATTTKGNGNAQACAACKYQRRKCAADCLLAPYFPHDSQRQFLNAHRLFGVSNITKIIKHLNNPSARDDAMRTIIFQSDARANDPVGGCCRMIRDLQRQIEHAKAELDFLQHHLAAYRASAAHQQQQEGVDVAANGSAGSLYFQVPAEMQHYQDDVSLWVLQDNSDAKQDSHVDAKPFDRRDEAMLRSVGVDDEAAVLKEERFSIQQANGGDDNLRDAATMFTLTHCTS